jgi:hypothetical protein
MDRNACSECTLLGPGEGLWWLLRSLSSMAPASVMLHYQNTGEVAVGATPEVCTTLVGETVPWQCLSWTQSATSSITSSKSKVPQANPMTRPARDPEKQGAHAKPSGDLVSRDQTSNRSPDSSRVLSCDKSRDSTRFGWARSPLINKWQTVGTVRNQRRHVTPVIG